MDDSTRPLRRDALQVCQTAVGNCRRWANEVGNTASALLKFLTSALAPVLGVLLIIGAAIAGFNALDQSGWISHGHDTPVWIAGDWMTGEYRDCGMLTTTPPLGVTLSETTRGELPRLFCGKNWDGQGIIEFQLAVHDYALATNSVWHGGDWSQLDSYFHILPVQYFGRIDRPDRVFDWWRCQRLTRSLECKALN